MQSIHSISIFLLKSPLASPAHIRLSWENFSWWNTPACQWQKRC